MDPAKTLSRISYITDFDEDRERMITPKKDETKKKALTKSNKSFLFIISY